MKVISADKSKTIKNASDQDIDALLIRLRKENELQNLIGDLKRKSTPYSPFTNQPSYDRPEVSTEAPIESLYHEDVANTLKHFGILGMKWGVRRQPGPDGTVGSKTKSTVSEDYAKSRQAKAKGYKSLSNQELKELTNRMEMEKKLRELTVSDYSKGMEVAKGVLAVGTTVASIYALSTTPLGQAVKKAVTKT